MKLHSATVQSLSPSDVNATTMIKRVLFITFALLLTAFQQANAKNLAFTLPEMVEIPAGEFEMGCVSGIDCKPRELPVHKVKIARFMMAKTEVTADLWTACVEAKQCHQYDAKDVKTGSFPASYISWDDVQVFLTWLNSETGETYRLPSEAEWEYAARAGTTTPYNTGDCISSEQANSEGNAFTAAGCTEEGHYRKQTTVVASFPANAFGLHDTHGNMWEWVEDCWHPSYDEAPNDGSAWNGSSSECERHVMRGGAWHGTVSYMRSAYRFRFPKEARSGGLGFRLAKSYSEEN